MFFTSVTADSTRMRGISHLVLVIYLWWWPLTIEAGYTSVAERQAYGNSRCKSLVCVLFPSTVTHERDSAADNFRDNLNFYRCVGEYTTRNAGILRASKNDIENCVHGFTDNRNFKVRGDFRTHHSDEANQPGVAGTFTDDDAYKAAQFYAIAKKLRESQRDPNYPYRVIAADMLETKARRLRIYGSTSDIIPALHSVGIQPLSYYVPITINPPPAKPIWISNWQPISCDNEYIIVNGKRTKFPKGSVITNTPAGILINGELLTYEMFIE